jgi:adenylate cyclase
MSAASGLALRDGAIYRNVLANMADGVMTLDLGGQIVTFNAAAGRMLGLDPEAVVGGLYAEHFFDDPGYDDFNELVLKAVYEQELSHHSELDVIRDGARRTLAASTTFLREHGPEGGAPLGVIVVFNDVTERRKRRKLKRLFGEYIDPRILDRLLARADQLEDGGERRVMSVSFCDLVGFTGLTETLAPGDLIGFLNSYFGLMTAAVAGTGGVTDKFIGDAVMAFWGPPFTPDRHAEAACRSALAQLDAVAELRAEAARRGLPIAPERIGIRIGVATGEVVAGSIGAPGARSYTVVGDAVNIAARLEAANKELGTTLVVDEATRDAAGEALLFRSIGEIRLRGRAGGTTVFSVEGPVQAAAGMRASEPV